MANTYQVCNVKCESYATTISSRIYDHLVRGSLGDCFISAEGKFLRAHKLILSISSEYFETIFNLTGSEKPVIIMPREVKFSDLCLILDFAYLGQAQVPHDRLDDFLKAGEQLQIRGIKEGRIHFLNNQAMTPMTQSQSFDSTISSTQETFTNAPPAKRPREDDDISIQEASEIMKMLLENNPDIDAETMKINSATPPAPIPNYPPMKAPAQQLPTVNYAMRKPVAPAPAIPQKEKQKFTCQYCLKSLCSKGRMTKHEIECNDNPNRQVVKCDICQLMLKPSSLAQHKSSKHGQPKKFSPSQFPNDMRFQPSSSPIINGSSSTPHVTSGEMPGQQNFVYHETIPFVPSPQHNMIKDEVKGYEEVKKETEDMLVKAVEVTH